MSQNNRLDDAVVGEALRELALRRQSLSEFILKVIQIDPIALFRKLINSKLTFTVEAVCYFLDHNNELKLPHMDISGMLHRIDEQECFGTKSFVCSLAAFNKRQGSTRANLELVQRLNRSLSKDKSLVASVVAIMNN